MKGLTEITPLKTISRKEFDVLRAIFQNAADISNYTSDFAALDEIRNYIKIARGSELRSLLAFLSKENLAIVDRVHTKTAALTKRGFATLAHHQPELFYDMAMADLFERHEDAFENAQMVLDFFIGDGSSCEKETEERAEQTYTQAELDEHIANAVKDSRYRDAALRLRNELLEFLNQYGQNLNASQINTLMASNPVLTEIYLNPKKDA